MSRCISVVPKEFKGFGEIVAVARVVRDSAAALRAILIAPDAIRLVCTKMRPSASARARAHSAAKVNDDVICWPNINLSKSTALR